MDLSIIFTIVATGIGVGGFLLTVIIMVGNHQVAMMSKAVEAGIAKAQLDVYLHYDSKE